MNGDIIKENWEIHDLHSSQNVGMKRGKLYTVAGLIWNDEEGIVRSGHLYFKETGLLDAKIGRKTWGNDDKVWGMGGTKFQYVHIHFLCVSTVVFHLHCFYRFFGWHPTFSSSTSSLFEGEFTCAPCSFSMSIFCGAISFHAYIFACLLLL